MCQPAPLAGECLRPLGQLSLDGSPVLEGFCFCRNVYVLFFRAPSRIRTGDRPLTRRMLWPSELKGRGVALLWLTVPYRR